MTKEGLVKFVEENPEKVEEAVKSWKNTYPSDPCPFEKKEKTKKSE